MELAVASCSKQFDCCSAAEIMEQYMGITYEGQPIDSEERCVAFSHAVFESFAAMGYRTSIEQGRSEYDGAAAAACIAAIDNVSCQGYTNDQVRDLGDCRPFILPKVGDGGGCTQDYECISGNCEGEDTPLGEPHTDGVCKPVPGANEPCEENCPAGHYCGSDLTTTGDVCLPHRADGAQCIRDEECASDYCNRDNTRICAERPPTCDGT